MYKHWRVRTIEIAISIIFCATIAFSSWQSVSAQDRKYAGNSRANTQSGQARTKQVELTPALVIDYTLG